MRFILAASILALLASCGETSRPRSQTARSAEAMAPPVRGQGRAPESTFPQKVKVISRGGEYERGDYTLPGYVVILDFYADW